MDKLNMELQNLSQYACAYNDAQRLKKTLKDIRPDYFRDIDRIIHCRAFTRYVDKTQVFTYTSNDNISKRIIHVQFVSKIARTIGRALKLNEDLIEAAALGHDIGHAPFGHVGERFLNEFSYNKQNKYFSHNVQSVRVLKDIEKNGKGLNLTYQVLDAILCHNGEFASEIYKPKPKDITQFLEEYELCYTSVDTLNHLCPATLEGCVVRISDIIAYLGRDIEDAIALGIITKSDIPSKIVQVLGNDNKTIINTLILDIINNSFNKPYIKLSPKVYQALIDLKKFNYEFIYAKANDEKTLNNIKKMFEALEEKYLMDIRQENYFSSIYKVFLHDMSPQYLKKTSDVQKVIDYISSMTDDYFINEYEQL